MGSKHKGVSTKKHWKSQVNYMSTYGTKKVLSWPKISHMVKAMWDRTWSIKLKTLEVKTILSIKLQGEKLKLGVKRRKNKGICKFIFYRTGIPLSENMHLSI